MDRRRTSWAPIAALVVAVLVGFAFWTSRRSASPDSDPDERDPRLADEDHTNERPIDLDQARKASRTAKPDAEDLEPLPLRPIVARAEPDAMRIAGWVVNFGSRRPVPGAELVFMHESEAHPVTTDVEGHFRFDAPAPGEYELGFVSAEGYLPYAPELGHSPVVFQAREGWSIDDVVFNLIPAIDMTGTVLDAAGEPVEGAEVRLFGAASGERALVSLEDRWRTDASGQFAFHAPDWAVLEASHADHGVGRAAVDTGVQVSHAMTIRLDPDLDAAQVELAGVVVDANGEPVADVRIEASSRLELGESVVAPSAQAISEVDGRFELGLLVEASSYQLTATHPSHPVVEVDVPANSDSIRIELPAGVSLSGVVVDGAGEPVPAATVTLLGGAGVFRTPLASTTVHDARGTFAFVGVEPGSYRLEALASGLAPGRPMVVDVPAQGRDDVRIELSDGVTVTGRVTDAHSDEPLAGARISVRGLPPLASSLVVPQSVGLTDEDGRFELRGVAPGRRSLNVAAFNHHPVALSGLELAAGETHGPIQVELRAVAEGEVPTSEISGIGAMLGASEEALLITGVLPDGGAEKAGLTKGDLIHAIDGEPILDVGFEAAIEAIRGPEGTIVTLDIERGSDGERVDVPVLRARVVVPPSP